MSFQKLRNPSFERCGTAPLRSKKEIFGVQALRGVAAWMVIFNHAQIWQTKNFHGVSLLPGQLIVGESGVDLFFIISGFIMVHTTPRAFAGIREQASFLVRRFLRIYLAYWAVAIPLTLLWFYNPKLLGNSQGNQLDIVSSFLLLPSQIRPVLSIAWTLVYEIYFYSFVSVIFYFEGRKRLALTLAWFLVIALRNILHPEPFVSPCLNIWLGLLTLEFITGMLLAMLLEHRPIRISSVTATLIITGALFFPYYYGARHGSYFNDVLLFPRLAAYGIPWAVIVWVVLQMEADKKWNWLKKLATVGDRSYTAYLIHLPILGALLLLGAKLLKHPTGFNVFVITIVILVMLAVLIEIFYRFVEKPSHAIAKQVSLKVAGREISSPALFKR